MADAMKIQVFDSPAELADRAAEWIVDELRSVLERSEAASLMLAGGSTPAATYERLAGVDDLDWSRVDFWWGDERVVSPDDSASNVGLARRRLLGPLGIDEARIHAPKVALGADDAALAYGIELRNASMPPRLDLVLLGMGSDGHTASLFPGGPELDVPPATLVCASRAPVAPHERITVTLPLLAQARSVLFLVSGESKREAFARVRAGDTGLPAARVRAERVRWLVDRDAVGE